MTDTVQAATIMPGLSGKAAIVWGGGGGMGLATAKLLAQSGCRLALVDRNGALAAAAAAALAQQGAQAVGFCADVSEEVQVEAALHEAAQALGPVTLSANIVGVAGFRPAIDMTVEEWERDQRLNLRPMFLIGRAMARHIRNVGERGSLVFVGSVSGMQAAHAHSAYGAAKRAMESLAQSFAAEWGPLGIRVNLVAPGVIRTERIAPSAQMDALIAQRVPAGRMGEVEDMAHCIAFLLSDLSAYVTGHTLVADGGWMTVPAILPSDNPRLPG
jgi:NAD(P)-dependent dehydrogenase (short-subunit alcohol dehydrogenase family)